jgi:hypothetical protein
MNINIYSSCQELYTQVRMIEETLAQPQVEPEVLEELFQQLDEVHASIGCLQSQAQTVDVFAKGLLKGLNALREQVVELYGRVHTLSVDREFLKIQEETLHLSLPLQSGDIQALAKEVDQLREHINFLNQTERSSLQNQQVVALATLFLEKVDAVLAGKMSPDALAVLLNYLRSAFKEIFDRQALTPEVMEQIMELIEVADLLYHYKSRDARRQFNQLPEDVKRRIEEHMALLEATSFEDAHKTTQAIFATMDELSETAVHYPSREEIDSWFMESHEVAMQA